MTGPARRPAVFLDRDGVLNRARVSPEGVPLPPLGLDDLELLPGVLDACATLAAAGFALVVVTNQPDVARGTTRREDVERINDELRVRLPLDDVRVCFHDDADGCDCRKPAPGLLVRAAEELGLDLERSVMVGDRWRDVEAGRRAGCRTVWIDAGYRERAPIGPDLTVQTLTDAVAWIVGTGAISQGRDRSPA